MVTGSYASSLQGEPRLTHGIDLVVVIPPDAVDESQFSRKIRERVLGVDLVVSAPEDTILAKLRGAKLSGGSEKQYRDALRVYELQNDALDIEYIRKWVKQLGVETDWERIAREANI